MKLLSNLVAKRAHLSPQTLELLDGALKAPNINLAATKETATTKKYSQNIIIEDFEAYSRPSSQQSKSPKLD